MLEKAAADRRVPSVARAAASPTAIVLAGSGVLVGEAAHLGLAVAVVLGAAGYGARVGWAAVHRRLWLRKRASRRAARVDPWSVPEPWRGYAARALDARKRLRQLARDCAPGPVADYLTTVSLQVDAAVEEQWALARSGATLASPGARVEKVAEDLKQVQTRLRLGEQLGAARVAVAAQEEALASELRSLRQNELVSAEISSQLAGLSAQLDGVVAAAAHLVGMAGAAGADLGALSSELASLRGGLEEARRIMASGPPGQSASGNS